MTLESVPLGLQLGRYRAAVHHLDFMRYTWVKPDPFLEGYHTKTICEKLDAAVDRYKRGLSSFLIIKVPFRHGKSDIISRYFPAHFMGMFPDAETMIVTYAASLSYKFSRFGRRLIASPRYQDLFPRMRISSDSASVASWGIEGHLGQVNASGLYAGLTGNGYHLGILDDFLSSRAQAESQTIRDKGWDAFADDFLTRRAPVSITIVLATPWNIDDIIGRTEKAMRADPNFPRFEVITFPAMSSQYPSGYLFPERFSPDWYKSQAATLGTYGTASLLQCNPIARTGNLFKTGEDNVVYHAPDFRDYPRGLYMRVWDLAHTEKQRVKDDPDWTSGTLLRFEKTNGLYHLWIKDVARIQAEAPERDKYIREITAMDGPYVKIGVSNSLDSKDAASTLRKALLGKRSVSTVIPRGDKVARSEPLEAIFEAGHVHLPSGAGWLPAWLEEVRAFPRGPHDDQVDNLSDGYALFTTGTNASSDESLELLRTMKIG